MKQNSTLFVITILTGLLLCSVIQPASSYAAGEKGAGQRFHEETTLNFKNIVGSLRWFASQPAMSKRYKGRKIISLPKSDFVGKPFEEALRQRRSVRNFVDEQLSMLELSLLLFAAQGITGREQGIALRSAPSAGALYPMEIYAVVMRVEGLEPGLYHYASASHALELIEQGDFSGKLIDGSLGQEMVGQAAVTFITTAVFARSTHKYGERGYRYAYMEAGHISQNISLQAASLGLGSVCVGAFFDDSINELIGVDGKKEAAIYIHAVGRI